MLLENFPPSKYPWVGSLPSPLLPSRVMRALCIVTSEPSAPLFE